MSAQRTRFLLRLTPALLVVGVVVMVVFERWFTLLIGMVLMLAFVVLGTFLVAAPGFLDEDQADDGGPEGSRKHEARSPTGREG